MSEIDYAALGPERGWVERMCRGLGCGCPDEVFESIRLRTAELDGAELLVEVGARLLVALVDAADAPRAEALLERGRALRDREGLNRFRLVLVGQIAAARLAELERAVQADDRLHVHAIDAARLAGWIESG
ncbi:MAG: hypothetical protein JXR96_21775 [Deltaproteobacteria bacterium]|nr:hypothetical protein [Deltaproteobacteria bacterium]